MNIDKITSQIISNSLFFASEEMGIALRNAAYSPNIKERMDHSAAIFDDEGRLIAQAEHIPVHLGSLPWGIKKTMEYLEKEGIEWEEKSMIVLNNPYIAGTHLNDITVIRPVFYGKKLVAFVANKAHHSDIGGKVPGSISFDAKSIFEEGLVLDPVFLIKNDEFQHDILSIISSNSRNPYERLGDIKAQVAANYTGEKRILEVIDKYGLEKFKESNLLAFEYGEKVFLSKIEKIEKGTYEAIDYIEKPDYTNLKLQVKIEILKNRIKVDYEGTDKQVDIPLNAVLGVTISGVHFVFKTLLGEDLPLNYGAFKNIEIIVPSGTILNPEFPYPVAGGNVETSQRNADVLYLAMSKAMPEIVPAASGGSMNNVMIGGIYKGKTWAFYETIGVGLGGRYGMDGTDGIQANMTNTMNTPIEDIERNFPIIIRKYEFRVDSSGAGKYRGGSGIIRSYVALENGMYFTILADRGKNKPWGLFGGKEGENTVVLMCKNKRIRRVNTKCTLILNKDEWIEIRTAGGGGYGNPNERDVEKIHEDLLNGIVTKSYIRKNYPQYKL
ncbi:MAG: hydantoinase B/oxoprolinase family protein [Thermoproteota archaeon]|jgi:N-methylhydantoinase B/acetone carboxylase, alpha subunit